jgi:hypothetical protein
MVTTAGLDTEGKRPPLLVPTRNRSHGPVTAARLRRTAAIFGTVWGIGLLLVLSGYSPAWKAFGLGLLVPGGGLLYTSDLILFALTWVFFALSLIAWFGMGNIVAPPVIWVGAAVLSTLRVDTGLWTWVEVIVPFALGLALVLGFAGQRRAFQAAQRRGEERNRYLSELTCEPVPLAEVASPAPELTSTDLAAARFLLDLALQPVERFDGFDWLDQFQTASVRYQLNFGLYALAMLQHTRTPSFHGYLAEAQRNLIAKIQDKRVWKYWRTENLWGNLDPNPDPIPNDNIMLSGYLGLMIGAYESNTGDRRYDSSGAIVFRWNDEQIFEYDHGSIAHAVYRNFVRSPFGMFPCEPNWIYVACNTFGINTLLAHDRLHGTAHVEEVLEGFTHAMNAEFLTPDGRVTAIRSSRLGLTIPSLTSTMADAGTAYFLSPSLPEVAQRTWILVRKELISIGEDGKVGMQLRGWDKLDVGNYKRSEIMPHAVIMAAAREMGDEEVYEAMRTSADSKFDPVLEEGVLRYKRGSVLANCYLASSRFGRAGGFHDLVTRGLPASWCEGPVLEDAPYPAVLVARAATDGKALDLVLRPGEGGGRVKLGIGRLISGRSYSVTGALTAEVVASTEGLAGIEVDLADRTEVRIAPRA